MASLMLSLKGSKKPIFHSHGKTETKFSTIQQKPLSFSTFTTAKYFDKILIANRGEIACRIMKTCKRLGIKTVAVHSDVDAGTKFVKMADEAVCIGPAATAQSYLNQQAILAAVKKTGAQAVHPGYGFLSENEAFAKLLEDNGIVWIGPPSSAIRQMGNKIQSKTIAKNAGVSTIPGRLSEAKDAEEMLVMANEIGYPVMIKASHGGGGKGMRIVWNDQEAREGFRLCKQEAKASFGSDDILIEKFIDNPRHIEIQLMVDGHGNGLYLNERECSIQRRNQKVVEEAPSSFLDAKTRKAMGEQAVALAKAVGYRSAGTCEFLVDPKRNFYFLEMNTRLQVEHPVTEYITGLDLVEQMIKIAAGKKLHLSQEDVPIKGWAMETRVYAEDPYRNFLPSIGTLHHYREPFPGDADVRSESGVREGDEISIHYDPMICKLVTYGPNRKASIEKMKQALDSYVIRGVNHNVAFLRSVLESPRFVSGDISTKFIPQEYPQGFKGHTLGPNATDELIVAAAVVELTKTIEESTISGQLSAYEQPSAETLVIEFAGKKKSVSVVKTGKDSYNVEFVDESRVIPVKTSATRSSLIFEATIGGNLCVFQVIADTTTGYKIQYHGTIHEVAVQSPREAELQKYMLEKKKVDLSKSLLSPMPGRIHSIAVKEGDKVSGGQEILIVEAMKMQNILRAPDNLVIKKILVVPGKDVALDELLVEFGERNIEEEQKKADEKK